MTGEKLALQTHVAWSHRSRSGARTTPLSRRICGDMATAAAAAGRRHGLLQAHDGARSGRGHEAVQV